MSKQLQLFDSVTCFDVTGGPWARGYCRANLSLTPESWFFKGHFKNDPCMPGTLMFEGCLQLMSFYLTGLGYTLDKDAWRFEPVPDTPFALRCRGQATPASKILTYELFIEEQIAEPIPQLIADVLVSVDGIKAFHGRGIGIQLVRDYPLTHNAQLLNTTYSQHAASFEGFCYDYESMLAFAWGQPSKALGSYYTPFDTGQRLARMPGPPYNFMHYVSEINAIANSMQSGGNATIAYVVPAADWYFEGAQNNNMPFCVLLEMALQPCGWLATFIGCPLHSEHVLCFRNLDGNSKILKTITSDCGTVFTQVTLNNLAHYGDTFILSFAVNCFLNNELILEMTTAFGFFTVETFQNQAGIPPNEEELLLVSKPCSFKSDLTLYPPQYFRGPLAIPQGKLLMLDEITGYWPASNESKITQLRGIKKINPYSWYFKAHFYSDPVQPGSLGLEAMIQLLKFYLIHENLHANMQNPQFVDLDLNSKIDWKYRGQVTPENEEIMVLMDVLSVEITPQAIIAIANASLWVDGKKIYTANNLQLGISELPLCQ